MSDDRTRLAAVARLFGALVQQELTANLVVTLRGEPVLASSLDALGLSLPDASDGDAIEALAAEYFEVIIAPKEGPPPIQSVVMGGTFEGDAAAAVRRIVEPLGLERDRDAARGAPVDHLGSVLELWAEISERAPEHADSFAVHHLAWALPLMRFRARDEGFYPRLCHAIAEFLVLVCPALPTSA